MIHSFKHKGLEELYDTGKTRRIDQKMHRRILRRLDALDSACKPEDMNVPGFDFYGLQGHVPKRYTIHINGPTARSSKAAWAFYKENGSRAPHFEPRCITFEWPEKDKGGAENVDYVQYH